MHACANKIGMLGDVAYTYLDSRVIPRTKKCTYVKESLNCIESHQPQLQNDHCASEGIRTESRINHGEGISLPACRHHQSGGHRIAAERAPVDAGSRARGGRLTDERSFDLHVRARPRGSACRSTWWIAAFWGPRRARSSLPFMESGGLVASRSRKASAHLVGQGSTRAVELATRLSL